jgi:hypothetical protein
MRSGSFDLLEPVRSAVRRGVALHKGKLSPYYTDKGHAVTRRYECVVKYKDEPKTPDCQ